MKSGVLGGERACALVRNHMARQETGIGEVLGVFLMFSSLTPDKSVSEDEYNSNNDKLKISGTHHKSLRALICYDVAKRFS